MKNSYTKWQRVLALALTLVLCITLLPIDGLKASANPALNTGNELGILKWVDDPITGTRPTATFMDGSDGTTLNAGKILVGKSVNNGIEGEDGAAQPVNLRSELFNMPQTADPNYGLLTPSEEGNFLITVSQSSQMYGISSDVAVPMDVVFVLDTSGSMSNSAGKNTNRAQAVVAAANSAIASILSMNEHNRIAVVGFSNDASVMSELYHYTDISSGWQTKKAASEHLTWNSSTVRGRNENGDPDNGRNGTNGGTNIQDGIQLGAKILTGVRADDTYVMLDTDGDGTKERVTRMPFLVVLSDGAATYSENDVEWWNPDAGRQGPGNGSYAGNGFLAALTAAYYKNLITQHYYGSNTSGRANIYTIGVGLGSIDDKGNALAPGESLKDTSNSEANDATLASLTMDPSKWLGTAVKNSEIDDAFNSYWTQYAAAAATSQKNSFDISVNSGETYVFSNTSGTETYTVLEWQQVQTGTDFWGRPEYEWRQVEVEKTRNIFDNIQESVTSLKYNDAYWAASSTEEINNAFKDVVVSIQKRGINPPTKVDSGWGENYSGFVTFTDPIGEYMEVKDLVGVTGDGYLYEGKRFAKLAQGYNPNWESDPATSADQAKFNADLEKALSDRIELSTAAGGALPTLETIRAILDVVTRTEDEGKVSYSFNGITREYTWEDYGGQMYYNNDDDYGNSFVWFGKVHYPEGSTAQAMNTPYDVQFIGVAPKNADSAEWLHTGTNAAMMDAVKAAGANCVVRSYFMNGYAGGARADQAGMLHFQVRVITSLAEPHPQVVSIKAPASLLAVQNVLIDNTNPETPVAQYDALLPRRVIYEVGLRSDINVNNVWSIVDEDYLSETLADGTLANVDEKGNIRFYTNDWDRSAPEAVKGSGTSPERALAHANFDVAANNSFYRYEKDTLLLNAQGKAITSAPVAGQTYYYSRTFYTWTPEADGVSDAEKKTEEIKVVWPEGLEAKKIGSNYYIPAGLYTAHITTSGDDLFKDENTTGTASIVTHPQRSGDANDSAYTTWLGNNGYILFRGLKPKSVTGTAVDGTTGEIDGKPVMVGTELTYTINAANATGDPAAVTISDKIPEGTALVENSWTATVGGADSSVAPTVNDGVLTWNFADVPAGAAVKVSFRVTVLESAVATGTVVNSADIKTGDNEYTTNVVSNPVSGKEVVSAPADGLRVGDAVTFRIAAVNTTGRNADITVTDTIPTGADFYGETSHAQQLSVDGDKLTWSFTNVAPGARIVVTFTVYVNAGAQVDTGIVNEAAYAIGNQPAVSTNTVRVPVKSGDLQLSKTVEGTTADKSFALTLTEITGKLNGRFRLIDFENAASRVSFTDGVSETIYIEAGQTLEIQNLPEGATIRVSEDVPVGYTATYAPANTVTITEGDTAVKVTVTNTYAAQPTDDIDTMFAVAKILTSPVALANRLFYFVAQPVKVTESAAGITVGENDGGPLITSLSIGLDRGGSVGLMNTFSGMVFTEPGVYYFLISEQKGALEGITYDETQYLIKITVEDNGEGQLVVAPREIAKRANANAAWGSFAAYNMATMPMFENQYVPTDAELVLTGTKTLTGRNIVEGEFSFVATETSAPAEATGRDNIVVYGHVAADGSITFDPIFYSLPGEYKYKVTELNTTGQPNMSFDTDEKNVTVVVTNNNGVLHAAVAGNSEPIVFNNTYTTQDISLPIYAKKTLTNRDMVAGEIFTFAVYDAAGNVVTTGHVTDAKANTPANIDFGAIPFSKSSFTDAAGTNDNVKFETFTYTVRENIPTVGADPQITYDQSVYQFQVMLKLDLGTGELEANYVSGSQKKIVSSTGETTSVDGTEIAFTNLYSPPKELQIGATPDITKTVETAGTIPAGLTFGFTLTKAAPAVGPDGEIDDGFAVGAVIGTGTSVGTAAGGTSQTTDIAFSTLYFYEPGTYYAWLVENNGGKEEHGIIHDGSRYLVKIDVTMDEATGSLTAVPSYYSGTGEEITGYNTPMTGGVNFKNTYAASGVLNIATVKNLQNAAGSNRKLTAGMFNFTLTEEATGFEHNGSNDENGVVVFDTLTFNNEGFENNKKINIYRMKETLSVLPGIAYDKSEYRIYVELTDVSGSITGEVIKIEQIKDASGADTAVTIYDKNADGNTFEPVANSTTDTIAVGVIESNTVVGAGFTNVASIYAGTQITIPVSKTLSGRDMLEGEFSFTLTHVSTEADGVTTDYGTVVDTIRSAAKNDGVADTGLSFTRTIGTHIKPGSVITYHLAEVLGSKGGVTYDTAVYEIKVGVTDANNDGVLEAAIVSAEKKSKEASGADVSEPVTLDADTRFGFVNTYKVASTTLTLEGTKTLLGRDISEGEFVFEVYDTKGTPETADDAVITTGTVPVGAANTPVAIVFDPITYYGPGNHTYYVVERTGSRDGVSYSKAMYTVAVEVEENTNDGTLTAKVVSVAQTKNDKGETAADGTAIAFTNVYTPKDLNLAPYLEITKKLNGRSLSANEFDFAVELVRFPEGFAGNAGDNVSYGTNDMSGKVSFASFTVNKAGTYVYEITESSTVAPGVSYDDRKITVTVVVADDGHSNLSVSSIVYEDNEDDGEDNKTFVNTYDPAKVSTSFRVYKVLSGKDFDKETFTFNVSLNKKNGGAQTLDTTVLTVDKTGVVEYPTYTYTEPGIYEWTIEEVRGAEKVENGTMVYDTAKYVLTEEVRDNTAAGKLEIVSRTIKKNDEDAAAVIFTNTYTPNPITQNLDAVMDAPQDKTLTGREMKAGEFNFVVKDLQGNEVATGTNDAAGNIILTYKPVPDGLEPGILFTSAGTYQYTVSEVPGPAASVTYDPAVWTVRIDVTYDAAAGKLVASAPVVAAVKDRAAVAEDITFTNKYDAVDASVQLKGKKTLQGDRTVQTPGEFEFHLLNSSGDVVRRAYNDADGNIVFDPLVFTAAVKDLKLTIVEVNTGITGVTYSDVRYNVTINVKDDTEKGELVPTVVITDANNAPVAEPWSYVNSYKGLPTHATVSATKVLEGKDLHENEFSFSLVQTDKPAGAADAVITGATNDADGNIRFRVENLTENGRYTFVMSEVKGADTRIDYFEPTYEVYIDVTDPGSGHKVATVRYKSGAEPVFVNTFNPYPVVVPVEAEKVMTGNRTSVAAGEFDFEIRSSEGVVATGTTKADGSVIFDYGTDKSGIEIATAGIHVFTITEVKPAGDPAGIVYDEAVWTLTVETAYDETTGVLSEVSRNLTVTGSEADPANGIVFTNKYDPVDARVILKGKKSLSGRELTEGEFTFRLLDAAGNIKYETTNGEHGALDEIIFPALSYSEPTAAPVVYTIVEVDEGETGVSYATTVYTVTVEVTDDPVKGELVTHVTITDAEGNPVNNSEWTFENTYKGTPTYAYVTATKVLEGKDLAEGEFAFQLVQTGKPAGAADAVITGATNDADSNIRFKVENLTEEGRYTFVMSEINGGDDNVTYSDKSFEVYIDVEDKLDGFMTATVTYRTGTAPVFTNVYTPDPAAVTIKAEKKMIGRDLKAGEFKFVIEDANGFKLANGTNDAEGNILFTEFKLAEGKNQTLYIYEVKGDDKNVIYDSRVYILSIDMVNKDDAGVLVPEVHYPVGGVVFNNEYVEPKEPTPPPVPTPDTGDHAPVSLWIMMMAVSLCGITVLSKKRRSFHS